MTDQLIEALPGCIHDEPWSLRLIEGDEWRLVCERQLGSGEFCLYEGPRLDPKEIEGWFHAARAHQECPKTTSSDRFSSSITDEQRKSLGLAIRRVRQATEGWGNREFVADVRLLADFAAGRVREEQK